MIPALRYLTKEWRYAATVEGSNVDGCPGSVVLLYGGREVKDLLLKEQLQEWEQEYPARFKVVFCVGSRWTNVHMGILRKAEEYIAPPPIHDIDKLRHKEVGWVNEEQVRKYAFPPSSSTRVVCCGLPGVYEKLCGSRFDTNVQEGSVLHRLGYTEDMVIKL